MRSDDKTNAQVARVRQHIRYYRTLVPGSHYAPGYLVHLAGCHSEWQCRQLLQGIVQGRLAAYHRDSDSYEILLWLLGNRTLTGSCGDESSRPSWPLMTSAACADARYRTHSTIFSL